MPIKRRRLRKLKSKTKCEEKHALKRLKERFNLQLTSKELKNIAKNVGCKNDKFIKRLSLRLTAWETTIKNQKVVFIYDNKRKMIVTFMPLGYKLE